LTKPVTQADIIFTIKVLNCSRNYTIIFNIATILKINSRKIIILYDICNQLWLKDIRSVCWLGFEIKKWNDKEINTRSILTLNKILTIINNIDKIQYSLFIERKKFQIVAIIAVTIFFPSQSCVYDHISTYILDSCQNFANRHGCYLPWGGRKSKRKIEQLLLILKRISLVSPPSSTVVGSRCCYYWLPPPDSCLYLPRKDQNSTSVFGNIRHSLEFTGLKFLTIMNENLRKKEVEGGGGSR
jgi:hypothetical protein